MAVMSRRQLAVYAADQLLGGKGTRTVCRELGAVLVTSRRANQAELLASDIAWELERRGQVATASITSAHELSEQLRREITAFVKKSAKVDEVIISEHIDRSVIGGVRIETAAHSWDKTLSRKLKQVREVV
jgi:F-type H+-transporting ATPase subunit delta